MSARPLVIAGGAVVTPSGVIDPGQVVVDGTGRIVAVDEPGATEAPTDALVIDAIGCWVTPGFIDVQINGGHGIDLTSEPERADELGRLLPRYGVTSFVPTIITCADEQRAAALDWWAGRDESVGAFGAVPLGLHIEGPMLAATRRGRSSARPAPST